MKRFILGASVAASAVMLFGVPQVQAATGDYHALDAPCRILDTRSGTGAYAGPIGHDTVIHITTNTTTDFSAQGGVAQDCGMPVEGSEAQAVAVTVTTVQPSQYGHVRVFPEGVGGCIEGSCADPSTLIPDSSTVNYIKGEDIANSVIVPQYVNASDYELLLHNVQWAGGDSVDLIVDIVGYVE